MPFLMRTRSPSTSDPSGRLRGPFRYVTVKQMFSPVGGLANARAISFSKVSRRTLTVFCRALTMMQISSSSAGRERTRSTPFHLRLTVSSGSRTRSPCGGGLRRHALVSPAAPPRLGSAPPTPFPGRGGPRRTGEELTRRVGGKKGATPGSGALSGRRADGVRRGGGPRGQSALTSTSAP